MIGHEGRAIVWAQWRSISNYHGKFRSSRFPLTTIFAIVWYGFWAYVAFAVATMVSEADNVSLIRKAGPTALLLILVYWQVVPIMMVSTGVSLDLSRLMVYPIPHSHLFTIEVLLRVTTCAEMLLVSCGIAYGIARNPELPAAGVFAILGFAVLNLLLSSGLKDLMGRLLARKGFREAMVLTLVLIAALPQVLLATGGPRGTFSWFRGATSGVLPWGATSALAFGEANLLGVAALISWTTAAWWFSRSQFERTLRFDVLEARSSGHDRGSRTSMLDVAARFISKPFRDPFAVLLEKEIRFLTRSARFRLLFLMGFSFGLLIWLPMAFRKESDSFIRSNYLTVVSAYALMLLGEICFWNNLGLDRGAAQAYFVFPTNLATVLRAKNLAAMLFIALEIGIVAALCLLLGMPVTLGDVGEAVCATAVFASFLFSFGNLLSVRYPRAVDPAQSWKSGSMGRSQAYLLFLYPLAAAPVALAFGARFAFESTVAFYGVLALDLAIGAVFYTIALESAVKTAEADREKIVMALAHAESPAAS